MCITHFWTAFLLISPCLPDFEGGVQFASTFALEFLWRVTLHALDWSSRFYLLSVISALRWTSAGGPYFLSTTPNDRAPCCSMQEGHLTASNTPLPPATHARLQPPSARLCTATSQGSPSSRCAGTERQLRIDGHSPFTKELTPACAPLPTTVAAPVNDPPAANVPNISGALARAVQVQLEDELEVADALCALVDPDARDSDIAVLADGPPALTDPVLRFLDAGIFEETELDEPPAAAERETGAGPLRFAAGRLFGAALAPARAAAASESEPAYSVRLSAWFLRGGTGGRRLGAFLERRRMARRSARNPDARSMRR